MITNSIPFTFDPNEAKKYLKRLGHELKLDYVRYRNIQFVCATCGSIVMLQGDHPALIPDEMLVIINGSIWVDADCYCIKYRSLWTSNR